MTDTKPKQPVWLRAPQVHDLLKPQFAEIPQKLEGKFRSALAQGGFRCQARFAKLETNSGSIRKRNWAIPEWLWSINHGQFSLLEDRFVLDLDSPFDTETCRGEGDLVGVWSVDLHCLQFHEAELRDFFTLPPKQNESTASAAPHKVGRPIARDKWEDFALALALVAHTAGPEAFKSKRALYAAVERVLMSLGKEALDEKSVRRLLERFIAEKDSEKLDR